MPRAKRIDAYCEACGVLMGRNTAKLKCLKCRSHKCVECGTSTQRDSPRCAVCAKKFTGFNDGAGSGVRLGTRFREGEN